MGGVLNLSLSMGNESVKPRQGRRVRGIVRTAYSTQACSRQPLDGYPERHHDSPLTYQRSNFRVDGGTLELCEPSSCCVRGKRGSLATSPLASNPENEEFQAAGERVGCHTRSPVKVEVAVG